MSDETNASESLKQNIERQLAARAASDPSFITRVMLDPDSVVKPMLTSAFGDDGEINLAGVSTTVHVETGRNLHFVLTVPSGDGEVEGFGAFDIAGGLRGIQVDADTTLSAKKRVTKLCSTGSCPTVYTQTDACPTRTRTWTQPF
jgi:hypothetical protein